MALPKKRYTPDEYLDFDSTSDIKYEYLDGQIYAMAGAKPNHNLITASISGRLDSQLRERDCSLYSSDQRVDVRSGGLFAYPDLSIVCGEPEYDARGESLLNPMLIIEVLSPSTERYDRTTKYTRYKTLESLQQYVLVWQDRPIIEVFTRNSRNPNENWLHALSQGLDAVAVLDSIGCTLLLSDVYRRVTLEPLDDDPRPVS